MTTGLGWSNEKVGIDLSYSYLWAVPSSTGEEVVVATGGAAAGEYECESHVIALSVKSVF